MCYNTSKMSSLLKLHCLSDESKTYSPLYLAICKLSLKDAIRCCEELLTYFGKGRVITEFTYDSKINVAIPHIYKCIQENIISANERYDGLCEISLKLGLARLSLADGNHDCSTISTLVNFVDKKHRLIFMSEVIDEGACSNRSHLINIAIEMSGQYPPDMNGVDQALEHAVVRGHTDCATLIEESFYDENEEEEEEEDEEEEEEDETTMCFIETLQIMDELRPRIQALKDISDEDADNMIISIYEACCDEDDCYTSPDDDSLDELVNFLWKQTQDH